MKLLLFLVLVLSFNFLDVYSADLTTYKLFVNKETKEDTSNMYIYIPF